MGIELAVVAGSLGVFLLFLIFETLFVRSVRRAIPMCICVTGTRGKSSVVRLIAAGLRRQETRVVAKTTGSRAVLIAPEGAEHTIRRRAPAWILEQRGLLVAARRWRADVLVSEAMSVRPENQEVELCRILRPGVLVIPTVRLDHVEDQGRSLDEVAAHLGRTVPRDTTVFVSERECPRSLSVALAERSSRVVAVPAELPEGTIEGFPYEEWPENVSLALAVCGSLGVPREEAIARMHRVSPDLGALKAWRVTGASCGTSWIAVNGFAANDPESTRAALSRFTNRWASENVRRIGLLNLRWDRGDRTEQWCRSLSSDFPAFDRLFITGGHARAAWRRLRGRYGDRVACLAAGSPAVIMARIEALEPAGGLLFGFGNIGGRGSALVAHWDRIGRPL